MRTIQLTGPSLDALKFKDHPTPEPGPGEVLIRLRAASLNFIDIAVAMGQFPVPKFPLIPVADGAGEISELGTDVADFQVGDRVMPHFMPFWQGGAITMGNTSGMRGVTLPGSLAEYTVAPADSLVAVPEHLSFAEAATLPIVATTAWRAMKAAQIGPGSIVVLLGTGGIVTALLLAKASGAIVIVTSSSDEKLERVKGLGADATINYRRFKDWDIEVQKLTDGHGADLVLETGGALTFVKSLSAAAFGGVVFLLGS